MYILDRKVMFLGNGLIEKVKVQFYPLQPLKSNVGTKRCNAGGINTFILKNNYVKISLQLYVMVVYTKDDRKSSERVM